MLMAEHGSIVAAVNVAGAAMTWSKSEHLRDRLTRAAANAKAPVLLLGAENDFDLAPGAELAEVLRAHGRPYRRVVYPAVGTSPMDGHLFMYTTPHLWTRDLFAFLDEAIKVAA